MDEDIFELVESLAREEGIRGEADGVKEGVLKHKQDGFEKGWKQACHLSFELSSLHSMITFVLKSDQLNVKKNEQVKKVSGSSVGSLKSSTNAPSRLEKKCSSLLKRIEDKSFWLGLNNTSEEELENKLASLQKEVQVVLSRFNINSGVENPAEPLF